MSEAELVAEARSKIPDRGGLIERMADAIEQLVAELDQAVGVIEDRNAEVTEWKARAEKAEAALKFYANENSWRTSTVYACGHAGKRSVDFDGGEKARAALKEQDQ